MPRSTLYYAATERGPPLGTVYLAGAEVGSADADAESDSDDFFDFGPEKFSLSVATDQGARHYRSGGLRG